MRVNRTTVSFKRLAGAAIALLLVVSSGKLFAQGPARTPDAKNWHIVVGPGACDLKEDGQPAAKQAVSKRQGHQITWKSNAGQPLFLVFHVPADCVPPFKNMTPDGKDAAGLSLYRLGEKTGNTVKSGPIEKNACEGREIKYDQNLGKEHCDGIIIIQP